MLDSVRHPRFRIERLNGSNEITVRVSDFIVMTQTCDLTNMKNGLVALCPIRSLTKYEDGNPAFRKKGIWEEVRKGRREGLHLLASAEFPDRGREALVIDFREIYSLPIEYLTHRAASVPSRWRLNSPYLEHFSQAFARFFMRVGLPSPVPPIGDP
jgi:hypothetical protein